MIGVFGKQTLYRQKEKTIKDITTNMQQHRQNHATTTTSEQVNTMGRRKWKNLFRRRGSPTSSKDDADHSDEAGYDKDDSHPSLEKSHSTRSIGDLSDATSLTATSSFHSASSAYSDCQKSSSPIGFSRDSVIGRRNLRRNPSNNEADADKPIAPAARRPSCDSSIASSCNSSFYHDHDSSDDEDCSLYGSTDLNDSQTSQKTWMPEPPSNLDVTKYEYGDATPDHNNGDVDDDDGTASLGNGASSHSRSSVDSIPKVPTRRRRSSIHFGQEDVSEELTTTRTKPRGHEYVGQWEAENMVAAATATADAPADASPPQAPRRRQSIVRRRRNQRASISFGCEMDATTTTSPVYKPPSLSSQETNIACMTARPANTTRTSRRSSMKQAGTPRRASIQFSGEIEVNLPGHAKPVRRRTSITFSSQEEVKEVTPSCNLTNEPQQLWYNRAELSEIRSKNHSLIQRAEQQTEGGESKQRKKCLRGLEDMMESNREREERQRQAVDGVLTLQHLQLNTGDYDDEYMSRLYQFSSKSSGEIAAERGIQDAAAVTSYLEPTRREECRRLSMF